MDGLHAVVGRGGGGGCLNLNYEHTGLREGSCRRLELPNISF